MICQNYIVYMEYMLNGILHQDAFTSWDECRDATFSPDAEILMIVDKTRKHKK